MHLANVRNLFYLYRPKISLILFFIGCWSQSNAQTSQYFRKHLEHYDDKPIHYGFLFGLPVTRFHIVHSADFINQDSTARVYAPTKAGFRMGFVINGYLNERWDIRTTPTVSLYDRVLEYQSPSGNIRSELREATWVEIPLLFKYKSMRRMNSRMYMIGGLTVGFEANARRRLRGGSDRLNTKSADLSIDYGFGFEKFLAYTKIAPEIRFSHGLINIYQPSTDRFNNNIIRRLTTHTVAIYLMFE